MRRTSLLRDALLLFPDWLDLAALPAVGQVLERVQILRFDERWGAGVVVLTAQVQVDAQASLDLFGFELALGSPGEGGIQATLELTFEAGPVFQALAALLIREGLSTEAEALETAAELGLTLGPSPDFTNPDFPLGRVRLEVRGLQLRLLLPSEFLQAARPVMVSGQVAGFEADPDDPPVEISLGSATLIADSVDGLDVDIQSMIVVSVPPFLLRGSKVALVLGECVLDVDTGVSTPEVLALGRDASWRGVVIRDLTVWGLNTLAPFLPSGDASEGATAVRLSQWIIDHRGITGTLEIDGPDVDLGNVTVDSIRLGFDRSWYPTQLGVAGSVDLGSMVSQTSETIPASAELRFDPFAEDPAGRFGFEISLGDSDHELASLDGPLPGLAAAAGAVAALAGQTDVALLLGGLEALLAAGLVSCERLALTSAHGSLRPTPLAVGGPAPAPGGPLTPTLSLTLSLAAGLEIDLPDLGATPIELAAGEVSVGYRFGDNAPSPPLAVEWNLNRGLDVSLPTQVDLGGYLTITGVGLRRDEQGRLRIELGAEPGGTGDASISGLPDLIVITYDPVTGDVDVSLARQGQGMTMLIPGVLYLDGSLRTGDGAMALPDDGHQWGDLLVGDLRAFLIGNGSATSPKDHLKKSSYMFDLQVGLLSATRDDGLQALVITADSSFRPGLPLGPSGASLYGLGLTFAQNARPNVADRDYGTWFLDQAPEYSTTASKWMPEGGNWGFGAAAVLGSSPDAGRAWNAAVGLFLLLPGPVIMLTGKGNLFRPPPSLPVDGAGVPDAPFAAAIVLDLLDNRLSIDLRADLAIEAAGKELVTLQIPAEVDVDLENPPDFHVYLGRNRPDEQRIKATALSLYDISGYLMVDGQMLEGVPGPDDELPGLALGFGGVGGIDWSFTAGPVSLGVYATAGFDLGVSLALPPLLMGRVWIEGGIYVRVFGVGLEMTVSLSLTGVAPKPFRLSGQVRVQVKLPLIPDIDIKAKLTIGGKADWPDDFSRPSDPLEGMAIYDPTKAERRPLVDGTPLVDVPVDAGVVLAFAAPVGNDAEQIDGFQTDGSDQDVPVWAVATTSDKDGTRERLGYRHRIAELVLTEVGGQAISGPATWREGTAAGDLPSSTAPRATGGIVDRSELRLMSAAMVPTTDSIGAGASLIERWTDGWNPCEEIPPPPKAYVRNFTALTVPAPVSRLGTGVLPGGSGGLLPGGVDPGLPPGLPLPGGGTPTIPGIPDSGIADLLNRERPRALPDGARYRLPNRTPPDEDPAWLEIEAPYAAGMRVSRALGGTRRRAASFRLPLESQNPVPTVLQAGDLVVGLPTLVMEDRPADQLDAVTSLFEAGDSPVGWLRLDFGPNTQAQVVLLKRVEVEIVAKVEHEDGTESVVETADVGLPPFLSGGSSLAWELVRIHSPAPTRSIRLAAAHGRMLHPLQSEREPWVATFLAAGSVDDVPLFDQARTRQRQASATVISDLLDQRDRWAAGDPSDLLRPDTSYELSVRMESEFVRQRGQGALEQSGVVVDHAVRTVAFRTGSRPSAPLRAFQGDLPAEPASAAAPRVTEADSIEGDWQVGTLPGPDSAPHYRDTPLQVRFREARTVAAIRSHGLEPRVRLVDEEGLDLEEALQLAQRQASDLSAADEALRDALAGQTCLTDPGRDPGEIWQESVADLGSVLRPGLRYVATLYAAPSGAGSIPDDADLLHQWRFRASLWTDLSNHLRAHTIRHEVIPDPPGSIASALTGAAAGLTPSGTVHRDDTDLDRLLFDVLGLDPRAAPSEPEVSVVWSWRPDTNALVPVALVLDGPEPLVWGEGAQCALRGPGGSIASRTFCGGLGARVLIVPDSGALSVSSAISIDCTARGATASKGVIVPSQPPAFTPTGP